MALNSVYAEFGLQLSQGIANFMIGSIQADLAATLQKYRNEILKVQEAMNANRITINEIDTVDATVRLKFAIQLQAAEDQGTAEVLAAAAGVKGANVDSTMRGLRRSAAFAQTARKTQLTSEMRGHLEERRSNALATAMNTDITVHQKPSVMSAALGIGMGLLNTYQNNQTKTQQAGPSSIAPPSAALGLRQNNTLLDTDNYWAILPDVGG
jgi:hypothetical protein